MKFLIIGGDRRQIETAKLLSNEGHDVSVFGLNKLAQWYDGIPEVASIAQGVSDCDGVILPIPMSRDGIRVNAPFADDDIFLAEIFYSVKPQTVLFGGAVRKKFVETAEYRDIKVVDYYDSESVKIKNARLTAEGAVGIVINKTNRAVMGSKILVCGWGRIAKFTAKYLKSLGADVCVSSRKAEHRTTIECLGFGTVNTDDMGDVIGSFDVVINTVPALVINRDLLFKCKKEVFILDLASMPGGVDFASAKEFCLDTVHALSLPAQIAPVTSAEVITRAILEYFDETD